MTKNIALLFVLVIASLLFFNCNNKSHLLTNDDIESIKKTRKNFEFAWLENNTIGVIETLTEDAILMPHHGDQPIIGATAIEAFWFPKNSAPSKVTVFTSTIDDINGSGNLAYIHGRFKLAFEYEQKTYSNEGNYLNVLVKDQGVWKLSKLIWNDPTPNVQ
ncbi:nuclear transport factor 2 family protein [uncultured Psychroserpens sp.]|uniref:YybH family protein n=1 Tax=uncultured Psychroserpens sp. TaxID=255436 RepID=UPI002626D502|nr:nuclear transport factor 2 family protein [uncultured Psychroserpens sp.]